MNYRDGLSAFRAATEEELALLRRLLDDGGEAAQRFLPQTYGLLALQACSCGCPSIKFKVTKGEPSMAQTRLIVDDVFGYVAGKLVGLIVFVDDGYLSELEVYDVAGQISGKFSLPSPSTLTKDMQAPIIRPELA